MSIRLEQNKVLLYKSDKILEEIIDHDSRNDDKFNQLENEFVLWSKYDNSKFKVQEFRNKRIVSHSDTETNSPIKKWNKYAREDKNARVLLFSHVFNS